MSPIAEGLDGQATLNGSLPAIGPGGYFFLALVAAPSLLAAGKDSVVTS